MSVRQISPGLLAGAALLLALAGCAQPGQVAQIGAAPPAAPAPPTPTPGPNQAAVTRILAAYTGMRQAQAAAEDAGSMQNVSLDSYAAGAALVEIVSSVGQNAGNGWRMVGAPVLDPKVTALDLNGSPATATITDCMDVAGWHTVDQFTGKDVTAPSTHSSFVSVSQAQLGRNGWRITETEVNRSKPC
jgi:hypothetical protein